MAKKMFEAMAYAYTMSEAEWRKLKNRILLLRRHHIRALRQLQLFEQRGISQRHPLYVRAHKRLRHLEKRIDTAQHKLAHARLYESFIEPEPLHVWSALKLWVLHAWRRPKPQKQPVTPGVRAV